MKQVQAVIFDWAGTIVDFGSFAPTQIFVDAFRRSYDFDITLEEARGPMGLGKIEHIRTLGATPEIAQRWQDQFGRSFTEEDAQEIYQTFLPLQIERVTLFADPIEGVLDAVNGLKAEGIKMGSCSGYPRSVMEALIPAAAEKGYKPDAVVASDDLAAGSRPGPWMALQNVIELAINDVATCIKVDDATSGIAEGLNAGMWTVGLSVSGNEFGATEAEYKAMSEAEVAKRRAPAEAKMKAAGAHYVIDSVADLPAVVQAINARLAKGDRP
ncbi:phosphonoacetaldehyde hydrolase [Endozoicomonas numazuensis]|uniref:Phosphonoacetaldehyde hydrolase n=1 Tax=Endozoicomonas numazuensis TaxID=1137799 RepID=A0A081NI55_9GAMM|nr:phosphonoacetaldehyde hydrolase [Endozoicomonas numazuensis]KEQ18128.1 phosphonoacetaldehyde hydrolase [Endozoicomonas numazuensis]